MEYLEENMSLFKGYKILLWISGCMGVMGVTYKIKQH